MTGLASAVLAVLEDPRLHAALEQAADELAQQLAPHIADALREQPATEPERWVSVGRIAELFDVSTDYVRRHEGRLGGRRLPGYGEKSQVRFRVSDVEAAMSTRVEHGRPDMPKLQRRQAKSSPASAGASGVPLIPIRGRQGVR